MWSETEYRDEAVREICYNCGSPTARKSYNFFRRLSYVAGSKVWSKVWSKGNTPIAFYYAHRCKDHIRLIEIAVREDYQRQGLGRKLLYSLLSRMREEGQDTLTFRTPIDEEAQSFWLKMGARIMDVKGEDYEMQLKIKI